MDDNNIIDIEFTSIPKVNYYTATEVARQLDEQVSRIRSWSDSFSDELNIQKINGRKRYTDKDINNLKFIKELLDEKGMTQQQVKMCFSNDLVVSDNEGNIADNPLALQAISSALSVENKKIMQELSKTIMEDMVRAMKLQYDMQQKQIDDLTAKLENKLEEIDTNVKFGTVSREDMEKLRAEYQNKSLWDRILGR